MTAAERGAGAQETRLVALAGNPNVGKSTIFNALTGMHQHTGNWPGKTVALAQGTCRYKDTEIRLVDLPGTYALVSKSQEEALAAGFVSGGEADCVIAVCDATSLERSLILALQVMELTDRIVREGQLTTLMITHNMRDAIQYGNRLIMLHDGHVILDIAGEEKKKLTVPDLLEQFTKASGDEFANDRAILS